MHDKYSMKDIVGSVDGEDYVINIQWKWKTNITTSQESEADEQKQQRNDFTNWDELSTGILITYRPDAILKCVELIKSIPFRKYSI